MTTIPYRQALLIKRMAWRSMQPRTPSAEDERYIPVAVRMLTYVACLNYAMLDLEQELRDAGLLRHAVKCRFSRALERVQQVHQAAYTMLGRISTVATRQYNDEMDDTYRRIGKCVLLSPPDRAYNIVAALCRLIERLNGELTGRYDFAPAKTLYSIPGELAHAAIHDYRIDNIIERNTKHE